MVRITSLLSDILTEQHGPRIFCAGCQQDHPLAPLRNAECARIHDSVCPGETKFFEPRRQMFHGSTTAKSEHE